MDRWLHHRKRADPLNGPTRLSVAVDVSRGLSYMHHDFTRPVTQRDIKCSNILLDCKFKEKIADFELARILAKPGEKYRNVLLLDYRDILMLDYRNTLLMD